MSHCIPSAQEWSELNSFDFDLHTLCVGLSLNAKGRAVQFVTAKSGESKTMPPIPKRRGKRVPIERVIEIREQIRELVDKNSSLAHRMHPLIRPIAPSSIYGGI